MEKNKSPRQILNVFSILVTVSALVTSFKASGGTGSPWGAGGSESISRSDSDTTSNPGPAAGAGFTASATYLPDGFDEFSSEFYQLISDVKDLNRLGRQRQSIQILVNFLEPLRKKLKINHNQQNFFEFNDGGRVAQEILKGLEERKQPFSWANLSFIESSQLLNAITDSLPSYYSVSLLQYKLAYLTYLDSLIPTLKTGAILKPEISRERILPDLAFLHSTALVFKVPGAKKNLVFFDHEIADPYRLQALRKQLISFVDNNSRDLALESNLRNPGYNYFRSIGFKLNLLRIRLEGLR